VSRAPWDYLLIGFNNTNFAPIWNITWMVGVGLLILSVILYNFQGRRLRNYAVFLDLNEWLLWTSVFIGAWLIAAAVFSFDMILVLPVIVGGAILYLWIRFIHFPPLIAAYEERLARQRYFQRHTTHPEATIRSRPAKPTTKRRRR
jgi:hypothetical protein